MKQLSRRNFLKMSGSLFGSGMVAACGGSGSVVAATPVADSESEAVNASPIRIQQQNKALVFIMLAGGNDSFNMLVPTNPADFQQYQTSRSNLALQQSELLPLNGFSDASGKRFGLHPAMGGVQQLFNHNKLSFIANCGPLIAPTSKTAFLNNSAALPVGLMSHADQIRHWQTANPGERERYGWFGRYADILQPNKPDQQIAMNISLSGTNTLQNGQQTTAYGIDQSGSTGLIVKESDPSFSLGQVALNDALLNGINSMLNRNHADPFMQTFIDTNRHAQSHHEQFQAALSGIQPNTTFSDTDLSQKLKMVSRTIAASSALDLPQQTFFVEYLGWDHHDELLDNHQRMLGVLSNALSEFDSALQALNVSDRTIMFTGSDFGRTLTSNGNGTDHGWGGNMMVMGDAIQGGRVFGEYPSLALDSNLDAGGGVLIPTTAIDEVFAELSLWFGVEKTDLPKLFPNLGNFYDVGSMGGPLGFLV